MADVNAGAKALFGVIGGSGLYHLDNLKTIGQVNPETPWGFPASPITIAELPSGVRVAFVARHGVGHQFSPTSVPVRANIAALKSLGVRAVLAFSAVGSLREEMAPGDVAVPAQIIDRTKGIRATSFFDGTHAVAHASFGEPFSPRLCAWLAPRIRKVLEQEGKGAKLHEGGTIVCMEGPQFSTRAESIMYRQWGGDLINMSAIPEAKLAREAELSYALIATVTDYDSWRPAEAAVTAMDVFAVLKGNAETSRLVVERIFDELTEAAADGALLSEEADAMKTAIMPHLDEVLTADDRAKLSYILPKYFPA